MKERPKWMKISSLDELKNQSWTCYCHDPRCSKEARCFFFYFFYFFYFFLFFYFFYFILNNIFICLFDLKFYKYHLYS
ncbi:BnaC09g43420D [Brassica napus]|uniref:BnaC09g43420D protein n=1 Tax=Brassica napus TaxID=3708 RepID=A0A078F9Y8_BRANA|nr:BnaC09g43420D [Brassica napus]